MRHDAKNDRVQQIQVTAEHLPDSEAMLSALLVVLDIELFTPATDRDDLDLSSELVS